jgi:glycosyltransferase involved in cell wall biosynthesis
MVVHAAFPPDPRVEREVAVAVAEGHDVEVVALHAADKPAREVVHGASVTRLPIARRRGGGAARVVWEYLGFTLLASLCVAARTMRRRYGVVHINNPPDFLIVAAVVPKLLGARVILDVHDFSWEIFSQRFEGRKAAVLKRPLRLIEKLASRFADHVITVHEPYRRALIERGVAPAKISVVMNSVDETLLPTTPAEPRSEGFRVVYHGTVTPHYGVDLLVEAASRAVDDVRDLRLEIYGSGDAVPMVRARAQALGMAERTALSGRYVPHAEILRLVGSASVGVIPNLPIRLNEHALPTKLFEYVALGVPVVCADLPTLREHFSDEEILFYRAGDAQALAAALVTVAGDQAGATARAAAARRRYQAYRWPISAERYALVLAGAPGPAATPRDRQASQ